MRAIERATLLNGYCHYACSVLKYFCCCCNFCPRLQWEELAGPQVHVIGPEQGFSLPGATIVCGDSHTSTHGALGALGFGIGASEVEHVLATQAPLPQPIWKQRTKKLTGFHRSSYGIFVDLHENSIKFATHILCLQSHT